MAIRLRTWKNQPFLAIALATTALQGCVPATSVTLSTQVKQTLLEPLPSAGIAMVGKQPLCLYWFNHSDGSVWRSSLDGLRKELVVDCRFKRNGNLANHLPLYGSPPGKGSYLALGSVPKNGFTILDAPASIPTNTQLHRIQLPLSLPHSSTPHPAPAPYSFGKRKSPWTVAFRLESFKVLDHSHTRIAEIGFSRPRKNKLRYRFSGTEGKLISLLDCDAAILHDGENVVLWTLRDDHRYLLAKGGNPIVWPRDLSKPQRLKPVAKVQLGRDTYTYTLKGPTDLKRTATEMKLLRRGPRL